MNRTMGVLEVVAIAIILAAIIFPVGWNWLRQAGEVQLKAGKVTVHQAVAFDVSPPLALPRYLGTAAKCPDWVEAGQGFGTSPHDTDSERGEGG